MQIICWHSILPDDILELSNNSFARRDWFISSSHVLCLGHLLLHWHCFLSIIFQQTLQLLSYIYLTFNCTICTSAEISTIFTTFTWTDILAVFVSNSSNGNTRVPPPAYMTTDISTACLSVQWTFQLLSMLTIPLHFHFSLHIWTTATTKKKLHLVLNSHNFHCSYTFISSCNMYFSSYTRTSTHLFQYFHFSLHFYASTEI